MEISINLSDDLSNEECNALLEFLQIVSRNKDIGIDRDAIREVEDQILTNELGKGELHFSEQYTMDIKEIVKIGHFNSEFKIDKLEELPKDKLKYLNNNNLRLLPMEFIEENINHLSSDNMSYLHLDEDFIDKHSDYLNLDILSAQNFSRDFLLKHLNEMNPITLQYSNDVELNKILHDMFSDESGISIKDYRVFIKKIMDSDACNHLIAPYERDIIIDTLLIEE